MITIITTTLSRRKDALELGKKLLDNNLVVCSNIEKTISQYYWKGKYHEEKEYLVTYKTSLEKKSQAIKFVKKHHPYEIPFISSHEVEVSNSYRSWMDQILG